MYKNRQIDGMIDRQKGRQIDEVIYLIYLKIYMQIARWDERYKDIWDEGYYKDPTAYALALFT